ncbi:MAG: type II secretion system protein [Halobacteriaceae archaeon]
MTRATASDRCFDGESRSERGPGPERGTDVGGASTALSAQPPPDGGAGHAGGAGAGHLAGAAVARLAVALRVSLPADASLEEDLATAGWACDSAALRTVAATGAVLPLLAVVPLVRLGLPLVAGVGCLLGATIGGALLSLPRWVAALRRSRAVGAVPDLVGFAVLRGRVEPTPEATATFAATHGSGPVAAALGRSVRASTGGPKTAWDRVADAWGGRSPGLRRASVLLLAATRAEPGRRAGLFDRAFAAVLDGTRDRAAGFAADLRGPASALYAFGVVLPLALVGALPALAGTGVDGLLLPVVVGYDLLLPAATAAGAAWLLARRPVAFPPAPVPRDHLDLPPRRARTALAGAGAALVAALCIRLAAPSWTAWVVVPGAGLGGGLVAWYRPVCRVREAAEAVEAGLPDALALVGRELERGEPPEAALATAAETLDGPTGDALADADRVGRRLGLGVRESLLGEVGSLADVPSPRTRAVAAFVAHAGAAGTAGGAVLLDLADHVAALCDVERSARNELAATAGTLRSTAVCFAPLVGGATVGMAGSVGETAASSGLAVVPPGPLGVAIGAYVLSLSAILAALAAGLDRGLDRAVLGHRVGVALLAASTVYPVAVVGTAALV